MRNEIKNNSLFLSQTTIMEERNKRLRNENQNEGHIISDLSDDVLHHILSFLNIKQAVQTSILSKRWINLWKTLPTLTLNSIDYLNLIFPSDFEFVSQILSLRDDSTAISTLCLHNCHPMGVNIIQKTIKYAVSHNLKHLQLDDIEYFPSCIFSCLTLTSLNLSPYYHTFHFSQPQIFPNSLNLPALTTLSLKYLVFCGSDDGCVEPFSAFNMLNTLIVHSCAVLNGQNLRISSTKLVNLKIHMYDYKRNKSFHRFSFGIELYYAPSLHTFAFTGYRYDLYGRRSVLASLKHVNIELVRYWGLGRTNASILLNWLAELANIESLTITSITLMALSSFPDLLKVKLPSMCNLKSLKIKTYLPPGSSCISKEMLHFLLQNSPLAKVDFIKY